MVSWCRSVKNSSLKGASLVETIVTMLLVAMFFATAYVVQVKITDFTLDIVDPMPIYSLVVSKMDAIKAEINNSLLFTADGDHISYVLKNGEQKSYDFSAFQEWFPAKYEATASVVRTRPDSVVLTWQFLTPRDKKLYGSTLLRKLTQSVPVPAEIEPIAGGVWITLYNPATGIGSPEKTTATVSVRLPEGTIVTATASLRNGFNAVGTTAYYGLHIETATKPETLLLPSLYGLDGSYTHPVEVLIP